MTNRMIILEEQLRLMKEGVIGTTGKTFIIQNDDGTTKELPEPEPIHTFAAWKELGYIVRKGEHAIAKFVIWKYKAGKKTNDDGEEIDTSRMFIKVSHFFSQSQVDRLPQTAKNGDFSPALQ